MSRGKLSNFGSKKAKPFTKKGSSSSKPKSAQKPKGKG
jgi:hypothetical protein